MAGRKGKIIKRIYEEGRERTVLYTKKRTVAKKRAEEKVTGHGSRVERKKVPTITAVQAQPQAAYAGIEQQPVIRHHEQRPFVDHADLPSDYGVTRLTLLPKDPFWIFAYWEIAQHSIDALKRDFSPEEVDNAAYVLRMYDVTCIEFNGYNANQTFDIEVGPHIRNWYVNFWNDNTSLVGELGLRTPSGRFLSLARSNFAHTPRMNYSPRTEQIWMKVTDEKYSRPYVIGRRARKKKIRGRYAQPSESSIKVTQVSAAKKTSRAIHLTEEDIRKYYCKMSPILREIMARRLKERFGNAALDDSQWYLLEGESEEERRELFSMLPKGGLVKRLILGSSQELIISQGASEQLIPGSGGASDVHQPKKKRSFFFELNTELIVYGRTEPDAEVWLRDRKIDLRSDGTFSLRFALPDGNMPLEFQAISADKEEERRIHTYVDRHTIYMGFKD